MSATQTALPPSLAAIRTRHGESEPESYYTIARATGYHVSYVVRIFNGRRQPSAECLSALAAFLGVSMDKLNAALQGVRK